MHYWQTGMGVVIKELPQSNREIAVFPQDNNQTGWDGCGLGVVI